jgi:hypothetical protein
VEVLHSVGQCETRWETHHKVIEDTLATYPAVIRMLEDMIETETDTSVVAKANGLLLSIEKLEFIAMLVIFNKVLQMTSILSKTLKQMMWIWQSVSI